MIYLNEFQFPDSEKEFNLYYHTPSAYNDFYPAGVLSDKLSIVEFAPVTIFYGGNGSGKSTALNLIAKRLNISRSTPYNKTAFFDIYAKEYCECEFYNYPPIQKMITSDDIFRGLFSRREYNELVDARRVELEEERYELKYDEFCKFTKGKNLLNEISGIKARNEAKSSTLNAYIKARSEKNILGKSNGESALEYFEHELSEGGLYLLDEPENSLSALYQLKLGEFLAREARYFGCQLIIATHSPFILSITGAKIYNLDENPSSITYNWSELENMRIYYDFFKNNMAKFE